MSDKCILIAVSGKSGCKDTKLKQKQVYLPIAELEKTIKKTVLCFRKMKSSFVRLFLDFVGLFLCLSTLSFVDKKKQTIIFFFLFLNSMMSIQYFFLPLPYLTNKNKFS